MPSTSAVAADKCDSCSWLIRVTICNQDRAKVFMEGVKNLLKQMMESQEN